MHPKRAENPEATRPKVQDKDLDAMIKKAWDAGWWARLCANGHVMCYHPTDLEEKILVNNTAGDRHIVPTLRRAFGRAGLKV
jgi:hypothetical protein